MTFAQTAQPPNESTSGKPRLLIVEDESVVALDLEVRLERLGYEVCERANNAEDALAFTLSRRPDLVLMDIHLFGEFDGIEAAARIRRAANVPIIFLTAHSDDPTLRRAGVTEPYGYVIKPVEGRELKAAIEIAFCRKRAEDRERCLTKKVDDIADDARPCQAMKDSRRVDGPEPIGRRPRSPRGRFFRSSAMLSLLGILWPAVIIFAVTHYRPRPLTDVDLALSGAATAFGLFYLWVAYAVYRRRSYVLNIAFTCAAFGIVLFPIGTVLSVLLLDHLNSCKHRFTA